MVIGKFCKKFLVVKEAIKIFICTEFELRNTYFSCPPLIYGSGFFVWKIDYVWYFLNCFPLSDKFLSPLEPKKRKQFKLYLLDYSQKVEIKKSSQLLQISQQLLQISQQTYTNIEKPNYRNECWQFFKVHQ